MTTSTERINYGPLHRETVRAIFTVADHAADLIRRDVYTAGQLFAIGAFGRHLQRELVEERGTLGTIFTGLPTVLIDDFDVPETLHRDYRDAVIQVRAAAEPTEEFDHVLSYIER